MSRFRPGVAGLAAVLLLTVAWADVPAHAVEVEPTESAVADEPVAQDPAQAPSAPAAVTAEEHDESLQIQWSAPVSDGGAPVDGYQVVAVPRDAQAPAPPVVSVDADSFGALVSPLINGVSYDVEVRATNIVGASHPAAVAGKPHTVPGAPTAVSATAGDGSALVRWAPPGHDGGANISTFVVQAASNGSTVQVDGDSASAKLPGLQNGDATTFTVWAVNAAGRGVASPATRAVTPRAVASFVVKRQPRRRAVYGDRSSVRVALVTAAGVAVPRQRVNLHARVSRSSRWRQVDSDVTGSRGRVTLGTALPASAALRVRHPVGAVVAPDRALRSVVVAKRVSASVERKRTRLGKTVVVRGRVAPRQAAGSRVVLQRRVDGSWRRVRSGRMVTQRRYVVRWKPARVGRYVLRVRKRGGTRLAAGVSQPWRQRINPETAADVARAVLRDRGITLATVHLSAGSDRATAERNIIDVANGRRANTSCYGNAPCSLTPLDLRMLHAVRNMGRRGTVTVSELAGGNHAPGSDHYRGRGVDITWVNGRHVGYGVAYGMVVDMCRKYGASQIFTPANDPWGGHHRHVHCGWS